jgi:hypothetical protein
MSAQLGRSNAATTSNSVVQTYVHAAGRCRSRSMASANRNAMAKCVGSCMFVGRYSSSGQNVATSSAAARDVPSVLA